MKSAKIAPRSVRFGQQDQIKEIEQHDVEGEGRRNSWNPNLANTDVITKPTKQKNVVIAIVIIGAILLLAVIAIVLGVVLSQNSTPVADESLSYNAVCKAGSNQCKSSQGLSCPHGFCSCSSPLSWNSGSSICTYLTYNQACTSSNQCFASYNLSCTNGYCRCDLYNRWNSSINQCTWIHNNTLTYGDTCAIGASQCNSTAELDCYGTCNCTLGKVWTQNGSRCICPTGKFLNNSNLCEPFRKVNASCTIGGIECDVSRNLWCNNSICQCNFSRDHWSYYYETCETRRNYSQQCAWDDHECNPTLVCSQTPGLCNCSQYLSDHTCDCPRTKYYDSSLQLCVNRSSYNGGCLSSANYTCLMTLFCNGGVCDCPLGTNWSPSNGTCL